MQLSVGDKVVYPNQGVCIIEDLAQHVIAGRDEEFLILRVSSNSSTLMIPVSNIGNVGLRRLCSEADLEQLFAIISREPEDLETDWKHRYKDHVEKMQTGCIFEVGEVLQRLHFLGERKPLSFREKKMYDRAHQLVASEVAMVRTLDEDQAQSLVNETLSGARHDVASQAAV